MLKEDVQHGNVVAQTISVSLYGQELPVPRLSGSRSDGFNRLTTEWAVKCAECRDRSSLFLYSPTRKRERISASQTQPSRHGSSPTPRDNACSLSWLVSATWLHGQGREACLAVPGKILWSWWQPVQGSAWEGKTNLAAWRLFISLDVVARRKGGDVIVVATCHDKR